MRKAIITLFITLLSITVFAQESQLTDNKIIDNGKEYYLYEVKASDGFMAIGRKYGIAYKDIIDANPEAVEKGLKVGQILRIPIISGRNSSAQEISSDTFIYHKVEPKETLFFISHKYDVSASDIIKHNPAAADILSIGMELKIPKSSIIEVSSDTYVIATEEFQTNGEYLYHTVKPSETAYSISRKYSIRTIDLAEANPGMNYSELVIGEQLRIPTASEEATEMSTRKLTDSRYTYYRIRSGETLGSIATLFNIPENVIVEANDIDGDLPPPGYLLKIPHAYEYTVEKADEIIYLVKKKDDIRDIAVEYNVPIMDIQKVNPQVSKWHKLKKGSKLIIPTMTIEVLDTIVDRTTATNDTLAHYFESQEIPIGDVIKVAFVWPLYLELNNNLNPTRRVTTQTLEDYTTQQSPRSIYPSNPLYREFFFSALLAINELKEQGVKMEISIYDAKKGTANMLQLLEDTTLKHADIIFGPIASDHIALMSEFCRENRIRMVIPTKTDKITDNPYIYQIKAQDHYEYAHIARKTAEKYAKANIIVVKGKEFDKREQQFIHYLKSELYNPDSMLTRQVSYNEINFNRDKMEGLTSLMSTTKHNLIIIPAQKGQIYTQLIPMIDNYDSRHSDTDISLLGFSEWSSFGMKELENIFNVGCEYYTPLYTDPYSNDPAHTNYVNNYKEYFKTYPTMVYPYHGMLGYDITNYFIKGLALYGNQLENNLDKMNESGLCVDFNFKRVNNWGGFANTTLYKLEFTNNFDVLVEE